MVTRRRWFSVALPALAVRPAESRAHPSRALRERIRQAVEQVEVVDSHEHILPEQERVRQAVDFFTLAGHYAINDVISAGLAPEATSAKGLTAEERWRAFEPHWRHARFTGYGQALRIAIRDIYGFDEINAATLPKINEAIARRNRPGLYGYVLKERARIRYAVLDDYWNAAPVRPDPEFFVLARKFDRFILPATAKDVAELEKLTGVSIASLNGLKQAMERSFAQSLEAGMVAVKSTIAYNRELRFAEASEQAAAADFLRLMRGEVRLPEGFRARIERPLRALEDHMFHHLMRLAEAHRLPVQIHTGLLAGNGAYLANTDPTLLNNLFFLYPRLTFDLFHIGYPYHDQVAALAKLFPNVCIDFCWAHIISPTVARRALSEFLDAVPINKILGFGGDYRYPELTYGHLVIARRNIVEVLADKVEEGFCDEDEAAEIARLLLADNAARLFPRRS